MHSLRKSLEVHEYDGTFLGQPAHFKMTSVIGHVLSIDFPPAFQSWETTDPATLFSAPTLKSEANPKVARTPCHRKTRRSQCLYPKQQTLCHHLSGHGFMWETKKVLLAHSDLQLHMQAHVCRHLQNEAKGCDYLVLWLDCDREGVVHPHLIRPAL